MTAVVLINPKKVENLAGALRACACFGINQLWYSGDRITMPERLPREFRHKDYRSVELIHHPNPLSQLKDKKLVAVEIIPGAQNLVDFEHDISDNVFVFGAEDSTLASNILRQCRSHVKIPSNYCVNLAAAVYITLYDRVSKLERLTNPWREDGPNLAKQPERCRT